MWGRGGWPLAGVRPPQLAVMVASPYIHGTVPLRVPMHIAYILVIICLLLTSCSLGGQQSATPTATSVPGSNLPPLQAVTEQALLRTEQVLLMTPHPVRDLYSLAQRLKLRNPIPFHILGAPPR